MDLEDSGILHKIAVQYRCSIKKRMTIFHTSTCIVTAVFIIKNKNRSTSNTVYTYSNVNPDYNYSEDNVLYLDDSGILHLIDTASGKDIVYCDKPNCTHEGYSRTNQNPSCPAAFYGLSKAGAVIYNDHLYFIGNMSDEDMTIQTRLASSDTLTPEETAYYGALVDYAMECRPLLNHGEPLPEMPKLTDFDQSLQDYKAQVEAEIAQEAADAGMTVEEYAAAGYEDPVQPQEVKEPPQQEAPEQQTKEPAASDYYYSINEGAARRAKEMNSFSDYKPGSATAEYRHYVDKAFALAQEQKKRVDPMYHEKIDSLLDTYARKLAANMNHGYEIDARVPSIVIAGGSNFPVRQKEKQNAARDSNMQEWRYIQGLLDKIRSTGMGGIRQDDPQAIPKLQKKLAGLEKAQETMKAVNAYYAAIRN